MKGSAGQQWKLSIFLPDYMGVTPLKAALFIVIAMRTTNPLACLMHYPQDFGTVLQDDVTAVLELQLSVLFVIKERQTASSYGNRNIS